MSEEERREAINFLRNANDGSGNTSRGRGGRGRGGRTTQPQRNTEPSAEADFADISSGGMSCFHAEISQDISDMSMSNHDNAELHDEIEPAVLFVTARDLSKDASDIVNQSEPKMKSSPTDSLTRTFGLIGIVSQFFAYRHAFHSCWWVAQKHAQGHS